MLLYSLARPFLSLMSAEAAHRWTVRGLGLLPAGAPPEDDPALAVELWGKRFSNPVGLAAGFDKDADVPRHIFGLGFGFAEVGTITPRAQPGNPRPRVFRLRPDRAVINRYGFNSKGLARAERRLAAARRAGLAGVVGVNVGKNKATVDATADFTEGAQRLAQYADYLAINVSSPNTPGLRALQSKEELRPLIEAVRTVLPAGAPPLLLKIAPDLTDKDKRDVADAARDFALDGLIVTNTTIARPEGLKSGRAGEAGGLSGPPLMPLATAVLRDMYRLTEGKIPLIGVGGVASGEDAYAKIRAGASLVQLYTALVYDGPGLIARIKRDLADLFRRDGFASVAEAVGADHREASQQGTGDG